MLSVAAVTALSSRCRRRERQRHRVLQRGTAWSPSQVQAYLTGQATPVDNLRLRYLDPLL